MYSLGTKIFPVVLDVCVWCWSTVSALVSAATAASVGAGAHGSSVGLFISDCSFDCGGGILLVLAATVFGELMLIGILLALVPLEAEVLDDLEMPVCNAVEIPPVRDIGSEPTFPDHSLAASVAGDFLGVE